MWVTHTERAWRRKEEAEGLARMAAKAEASIAGVSRALTIIQSDAEGVRLLAGAGFGHLSLGRSMRLGRDGRAEGLAVLEAIVVTAVAGRMLSIPELVRWLSRNQPNELADLHRAAEMGRSR
jgi:hypothetical protein